MSRQVLIIAWLINDLLDMWSHYLLAGWAGSAAKAEEILVAANVSPSQRAEELSIEDFIRIASHK